MRRPGGTMRGVALASALFLLVGLATLAAFVVSVTSVSHTTTLLSVQGERAHFAARAGIEWAVSRIVNAAGAGLDCAPGTVDLALTEGALAGFSVALGCTATAVTEGAQSYTLYELTAVATLGAPGRPDHVRRTLVATVAF